MRTSAVTTLGPAATGLPSPQRIRWGAVFGGAILGIALLAGLTSLWFALAYASGVEEIRADLEWYLGGSAVVSVFIAGLLAGWLSGVRGSGSGFFNGVTIWALMVTLTVTIGVPAIFNVFNLGRVLQLDTTGGLLNPNADTVLWATFFAIVGGLVASGIGGAIGGAFARPANAHPIEQARMRETEAGFAQPTRPDVAGRTVVVVPEVEVSPSQESGTPEVDEALRRHRATS